MRTAMALAVAGSLLMFSGCVQTIAVSTVGGIVDDGFGAFTEESDAIVIDGARLTPPYRVLAIGARLIGVNNRDLRTFQVDLEHTIRLRREIPKDRVVVGESGIRTHDDAARLERAGVQAMLVGESLMASPDIGAAVDRLLGRLRAQEETEGTEN